MKGAEEEEHMGFIQKHPLASQSHKEYILANN